MHWRSAAATLALLLFNTPTGAAEVPRGSPLFSLLCGKAAHCQAQITADLASSKAASLVRAQLVRVSAPQPRTYLVTEATDGVVRAINLSEMDIAPSASVSLRSISHNSFDVVRNSSETKIEEAYLFEPLRLFTQDTQWGKQLAIGPNGWSVWNSENFLGRVEYRPEPYQRAKWKPARDAYLLIPQVTQPESYLKDGWKHTALGSCAYTPLKDVYILEGSVRFAVDLRVLRISDRALQIELLPRKYTYDQVQPAYPAAEGDETVIFWQSYGGKMLKWEFRVSDGRFQALSPNVRFKHPPSIARVDHALPGQSGKSHGYLVQFHEPLGEFFSIGFRRKTTPQSDASVVATSQVRDGDLQSLGRFKTIDAKIGRCAVENGVLNFKVRTYEVKTLSPAAK